MEGAATSESPPMVRAEPASGPYGDRPKAPVFGGTVEATRGSAPVTSGFMKELQSDCPKPGAAGRTLDQVPGDLGPTSGLPPVYWVVRR